MKDATGELSMTAVAVVAIAAIGVVFSTLVWPNIKSNITRSAECSQAFDCQGSNNGMKQCSIVVDEKEGTTKKIYCPADK